MSDPIIVIGAGMGGLCAAIRLAKQGHDVCLLEARKEAGGLAGGLMIEGLSFDAGPYVLLDRPGLGWIFDELGLDLDELELQRIKHVYEVDFGQDEPVRFDNSLADTADAMERLASGAGNRYRDFIAATLATYQRLLPLQRRSSPRPWHLLATGAWRDIPFMLRSLSTVMAKSGLPDRIVQAIAIWTHVAGQSLAEAPPPLAMVPALIHSYGAYHPKAGIRGITRLLTRAAIEAGVEFRFGTRVQRIQARNGAVVGVITQDDELIPAKFVISNVHGLATCLELIPDLPKRQREGYEALPLQSPGVCAYLAVKSKASPPYLRFYKPADGGPVRLLITPSVLDGLEPVDGWWPARLLCPMDHEAARQGGIPGQEAFLDKALAEPWWREICPDYRLLARRIPHAWSQEFGLYRDSINPVMTAAFMRRGRLAHRSPHLAGLYLAGSATHPGQWVSFCGISGILAADLAREDKW